ncbi:MAG: ECF transporter S component [Clostridia bacterium]|jgi:uncharacterized membrane protein|nr:ECF transporter S component [Clostridia bacterium]
MKFRNLIYTAVFAALCCVATLCIAIPLPYGYVNAGDIFVLLSGVCLGPVLGGIAAGLGSALADIFLAYALYAPATAVIKFAVALLAALIFRAGRRAFAGKPARLAVCALGCLAAEAVMVLGYFLYETILYGAVGAAASLVGNTLQGVTCAVGGLLLISAVSSVRHLRHLFPALDD